MGRYGTRKKEVDRLLREGVMVDLLHGVVGHLRASVSWRPSTSFRRGDQPARPSIVAFERWLELGEGEPESTSSNGSSVRTATTWVGDFQLATRWKAAPRGWRGRPGSSCRARWPGLPFRPT